MKPSEVLRLAKDIYKADENEATAAEAVKLAWSETLEPPRRSVHKTSSPSEEELLYAALGYLRDATLKMRLFDRAVALAEAEE